MIAALAAPSTLSDGEVTLRVLDSSVPALLVAASYDEEITRWTQVPHGMTLVDASMVVAGWASNDRVVRMQVCVPDLGPAGLVTVWINQRGRAEVGYWLLPPARGRGVARRAVAMLCAWAFDTCEVNELELTTLPGNEASERVALACGFNAAGTIDLEVKGDTRTLRLWVHRGDRAPGGGQRESTDT